jgi:two-component system chemotaxis response regulator CheB
MNAKKIRVLVVDDSFFMRKVIGDILRTDSGIEVVGEAANGQEALERIAELHPHVVTLDIEMPIMDGLQTLRKIVSSPHYPSVVMVSGYVQAGADVTLQCLSIGAVDFVLKPSGSLSLDMDKVKVQLIQKVRIAAIADATKTRPINLPSKSQHYHKTGGVVVIGASTGGPTALEALLPTFPSDFPAPIIVAQHLPKEFATSFANRLNKRCQLRVMCIEQNMQLTAGTVYIAPGNTDTTVSYHKGLAVFHVQKDIRSLETPSINRVMESAATVYRDQTIGVILTGMGQDGADGMARIKQVGGSTIVQDRSTSAVFGMGGEVVLRGLADMVVPLENIMEKVSELLT